MSGLIPIILFETDDFVLYYKPPHWDVYTVPRKLDDYDEKRMVNNVYKGKVQHMHVFAGLQLFRHGVKNIEDIGYSRGHDMGALHRYDVETSGGLLFCKKKELYLQMRDIINDKKNTIKIYLCLVNGNLLPKSGYIKESIECEKLKCRVSKTGKKACSYFEKLGNLTDSKGNIYSLVQVRIFTGRTHQIRIHMKSLGHTVVSDYIYADKDDLIMNKKISDRIFLHNFYLGFTYNKVSYKFTIPIANDLYTTLKNIGFDEDNKFGKSIYELSNEMINSACFD